MSSKPSETISLEALRNGDRAEFARMVEAYYAMIYRLSIKMVGNPQDAEDILQETFIKAYRHIKDFDGRSSLSTWLYRVATNEALMFLRRKRPEQISKLMSRWKLKRVRWSRYKLWIGVACQSRSCCRAKPDSTWIG